MRIIVFLVLLTSFLLNGCAIAASPSTPPASDSKEGASVMDVTGRVVFIPLEGGFYGIVGDDGQQFDPLELPEEYRRDGLPVRAVVRPLEGVVSFRMWGTIVEIVQIEKIPEPL